MVKLKEVREELHNLILKYKSTRLIMESKTGIALPYTNDGIVYYLRVHQVLVSYLNSTQ